jgi:tryptophan 2,3-dioxygenase
MATPHSIPPMYAPARDQNQVQVSYWDYLDLDDLLSLQHPRTSSPDERAFIVLHQVAELLFSLVIHELRQLTDTEEERIHIWCRHVGRIVQYFKLLVQHLGVTGKAIEKEEFRSFRAALFPASAFQSFQFRQIELLSARAYDLIGHHLKAGFSRHTPVKTLLEHLYWRRVTSPDTGEKAPALLAFEGRYLSEIEALALKYQDRNLAARYFALPEHVRGDSRLQSLLREYDLITNVAWPSGHLRLAMDFLSDGGSNVSSTGGADWPVYLRCKQQQVSFFPELAISRFKADEPTNVTPL